MTIITREQVLAANDIREEIMAVPEWGGDLRLRGLTLVQLSNVHQMSTRDGEGDEIRAVICTFIEGVVEPKFTMADYQDLRQKSGAVARVAKRINQLSGITAEDVDAAEKNSEPTPSDDSNTN